jgi:cytidylate kinase
MTVWTISWQEGSGGETAARLLARRASVELIDAETVATAVWAEVALGKRTGSPCPSWLRDLALPVGLLLGAAPEVPADCLQSRTLREMTEDAIREAARWPCVVTGCAAFAILADHLGACHVRIRAPMSWRAQRYACDNLLSLAAARMALARVDRQRRVYIYRAYRRRLDSATNFSVVCDASRFELDDLVEVLFAAGRRMPPDLSRRALRSDG